MDLILAADTRAGLQTKLRDALPLPEDKRPGEISPLRCLAFSSLFSEVVEDASDYKLFKLTDGEDPPDFALWSSKGKIAIEVTTFTQGELEKFQRRGGSGFYTQATINKRVDPADPEDAWASVSERDEIALKAAEGVLRKKINDLPRYKSGYDKAVLIVADKLNAGFYEILNRRLPELTQLRMRLETAHKFDAIILIGDNRSEDVVAVKL